MQKIVKKHKNHIIDTITSTAHGLMQTQNHTLAIPSSLSVVSDLGSMLLGGIAMIIQWQDHGQHNFRILIKAEKKIVVFVCCFRGGSACHRTPNLYIQKKAQIKEKMTIIKYYPTLQDTK